MQSKNSAGDLYRTEALNARKNPWLGEVVLMRPLSFAVFALIGFLCGASILAFILFASYTKRTTVSGQLLPINGLVKVYALQQAVIVATHIKEGDSVKKGEALFTLSSERLSTRFGETQAAISEHLRGRSASLEDERRKTEKMHREDRDNLQSRILRIQRQADQILEQISLQERRLQIAKDGLKRYEGLEAQRYFSEAHIEVKRTEVIDQALKLQSLRREQESTLRDLRTEQKELSTLSLKQQNQLGQLARERSVIDQEHTESEARRQFVVTAPESGTITGIIGDVGKMADPGHPLASIVPSDSMLVADLYAPSRAVGFIRPADRVLLRYQAYPYQKFGQYQGIITSVSKTALSLNEVSTLSGGIPGFDVAKQEQLYYRVVVRPTDQTVQAYGKTIALQSGMALEADILQERRRLYEWIIEPLYGLRQKTGSTS